jgi:DNA-binding CsgD family transcriptional regulator
LSVLANRNCTLGAAAEHLQISISTANHHIAAAKKAFRANTTAAAILHALRLGLIDLK